MNGIEKLEALNPVPEYRGNPGSWQPAAIGGQRKPRRLAALLVAAAAVVLVAVGAFALRTSNDEPLDLQVAVQPPETEVTTEALTADGLRNLGTATEPGDESVVLARLVIPKIDVDVVVGDGIDFALLREGPGHYRDTVLPGQAGNAAIAGHRTTYGAPFHRIDELDPETAIFVITLQGTFEYRVVETIITTPDDLGVLADFGDNRLTLTAAHPKYSRAQRIVVVAQLQGQPAPTTSFDSLPQASSWTLAEGTEGAPSIRDIEVRSGRQPYFSFRGSTNAIETAQTFVSSQFPAWDPDGVLQFELYEQTARSASVRWLDERYDTAGWIVMSFVDGHYLVFDMSMDGVAVGMSGTPDRSRGSVESSQPVGIEVMVPIPAWVPGVAPVPLVREPTQDPLVAVSPAETADGQIANLSFVNVDGVFGELRYIIRNETGDQIGGAAASMEPAGNSNRATSIVVHHRDVEALESFLAEHPSIVREWFVVDRFSSVGWLFSAAPEQAPKSVGELPQYRVGFVTFNDGPKAGERSDEERSFVNELYDRFNAGPDRDASGPPSPPASPIDTSKPAAGYVVDELPPALRCDAAPVLEPWRFVVNQVRNVADTPRAAIELPPLAIEGPAIEFTNSDGLVLGYAIAATGRPWTFTTVITVEQVDGGWVADRWEHAPCSR